MLRVGLTGGIGSGKSTVALMLRELQIPVLEADQVAREAVRPSEPAYAEILTTFGTEILQADGEIDRGRLAGIVFASPEQLNRLNRIVHPRVLERIGDWLEEQRQKGENLAIVEAPLLVETGYYCSLDRLAMVWCSPEQQLERLATRGMSRVDAERRISAQLPLAEKRSMADDVIDNSGTIAETRRRVAVLAEKLRSLAGQSGGGAGAER